MEITLIKQTEAINNNPIEWDSEGNVTKYGDAFPVMLWKFKDENGNLWNTETPIDGTEEDAASIILASVVSA